MLTVFCSPILQCRITFVDRGMRTKATWNRSLLQLVQVVVQGWETLLETLAFACDGHNFTRFARGILGVVTHDLPMVKHTLWECLATSVGSEICRETWKWTAPHILKGFYKAIVTVRASKKKFSYKYDSPAPSLLTEYQKPYNTEQNYNEFVWHKKCGCKDCS